MRHDLEVKASIEIHCNAERIWEVLTNPDLIKEYLFGTETITDWKVGSPIVFQGEYEGHHYKDKGIVREFIPKSRISYSYWSGFSGTEDAPENYSLVSYDVVSKGDGLFFTWTQKGFSTENGYNHSKNGMTAFLENIKSVAERA